MRILVGRDGLESDNLAFRTLMEFMIKGYEFMLFKDSDVNLPVRKAVPGVGNLCLHTMSEANFMRVTANTMIRPVA